MEDQNQTDKKDKVVEKDDEYAGIKRSQITGFREMLETATKVLVGVSVLSYIIGLLITNMHLRKYGAFHLTFAQFEYVLTGLLWLFLVGISYMTYATSTSLSPIPIKPSLPKWKGITYKSANILLHYLSGLLALTFPLSFLSNYELDQLSWGSVYTSLSLLAAPYFINKFSKEAYGFFQAAKQRTLPRNAVDSIASFIFVLSSLVSYTNSVYPKLSPVYGGGKQQKLVLAVKPDQVMQLKSLGINVSQENRQFGPLEVVYEAADYLILSTPEEIKERKNIQSIRLKKDMFDAILHVDDKYVKAAPTPTPAPSPTSTPTPAPSQTPPQ